MRPLQWNVYLRDSVIVDEQGDINTMSALSPCAVGLNTGSETNLLVCSFVVFIEYGALICPCMTTNTQVVA